MSRWVLWAMDPNDPIPVPVEQVFNTLEAAVDTAYKAAGKGWEWLKLFKGGDESDIRLRWSAERGFYDLSTTAAAVLAETRAAAALNQPEPSSEAPR